MHTRASHLIGVGCITCNSATIFFYLRYLMYLSTYKHNKTNIKSKYIYSPSHT